MPRRKATLDETLAWMLAAPTGDAGWDALFDDRVLPDGAAGATAGLPVAPGVLARALDLWTLAAPGRGAVAERLRARLPACLTPGSTATVSLHRGRVCVRFLPLDEYAEQLDLPSTPPPRGEAKLKLRVERFPDRVVIHTDRLATDASPDEEED